MIKTIKYSDLQPQDKPGDGWYIIEAAGEHPNEHNGKTIIQVIDAESIQAIVAAGVNTAEGLLIDRDHMSLDDGQSTEAVGWVKELAYLEDDKGHVYLCAWIEWSCLGRSLIVGKVYKDYSTVYLPEDMEPLGGNRYRPRRLAMLAVTNIPNNSGQRPITNRRKAVCNNNQPHTNMSAITDKLGLPEEATEEEILQAIDALQATTAQAQEAEAEAILNSEGGGDLPEEEKEMMKEELVTNRGRALKVLRARAAAAKKETGAKATAGAHPLYAGGVVKNSRRGITGQPDPAARAIAVRDRALEIQSKSRLSYWTALGMAESEIPQ